MAKPTYMHTTDGSNLKRDWWYRTGMYADANRSSAVPHRQGVYCIYGHWFDEKRVELLYIGSSLNIAMRLKTHSLTLRVINCFCDFVEIKFKICDYSRLLESKLIRRLNPRFNIEFSNKAELIVHQYYNHHTKTYKRKNG